MAQLWYGDDRGTPDNTATIDNDIAVLTLGPPVKATPIPMVRVRATQPRVSPSVLVE
ncbi:hypothetical protein ACWGH3_05340 [Streptomyces sp. NPDC054884]|uniref:hypothetical protein n=1 Tax=Streptomyces sp. ME08-AFT2 TaxID=3028683 RepID=UPI0029B4ED09|nr:hypothetical protein [Streptomyces sp. ME08-AFT2]MDX3313994.1 hypothetical protein [Streptomyces sp. ME08-AFT2]